MAATAQGGRLVGKSILISGAAQGIGRASALVCPCIHTSTSHNT